MTSETFADGLPYVQVESTGLLRELIQRRLGGLRGLARNDVEFCVEAMDVVASHPISTFDLEQSEDGRRRRRLALEEMERVLLIVESAGGREVPPRPFFTPY